MKFFNKVVNELKNKKLIGSSAFNSTSVLSGWNFRKCVTLKRPLGTVTNYQMKILVGESSGSVGYNVHCEGYCLSSFNDLRFTTSDGNTLLDYWIESITGTTPNQLATVWVEFDSIGTGDTTFYMYYGKSDASSYSNGDNTFLFFDDFLGTSIDGDKWITIQGTPSVSGSHLNLMGTYGTRVIVRGKVYSPQSARIRTKAQFTHRDSNVIYIAAMGNVDNSHYFTFRTAESQDTFWMESCAGGAENVDSFTSSVDVTQDIVYESQWSSNSVKAYTNETLRNTQVDNVPSVDLRPSFVAGNTNSKNCYVDWTFVSKYEPTEPTFGSWSGSKKLS